MDAPVRLINVDQSTEQVEVVIIWGKGSAVKLEQCQQTKKKKYHGEEKKKKKKNPKKTTPLYAQ
jgi:hypothetical protein